LKDKLFKIRVLKYFRLTLLDFTRLFSQVIRMSVGWGLLLGRCSVGVVSACLGVQICFARAKISAVDIWVVGVGS
jgi:hypothetical protein